MKRLACLCVVLLSLAPLACVATGYDLGDRRLALLDDPLRIEFVERPVELTTVRIRQAIAIAAAVNKWKVAKESDARIELLTVVHGRHLVHVEVGYDVGGVTIRYLESNNLLYRELHKGGDVLRAIHRNYNHWIGDLATAIGAGIGVSNRMTAGFAPLESVDAVPFLKQQGREAYAQFLHEDMPRAFTIALNGAYGRAYPARAARFNQFDAVDAALQRCNRRGNGSCHLYAVDNHVVWASQTVIPLPFTAIRAEPSQPQVNGTQAARVLAGVELEQHLRRITGVLVNRNDRPFTLSIAADGRLRRICDICPVTSGNGVMTVDMKQGIVCLRWDNVTYPDSGCYRVVETADNTFEMRGTGRERPIGYSLGAGE